MGDSTPGGELLACHDRERLAAHQTRERRDFAVLAFPRRPPSRRLHDAASGDEAPRNGDRDESRYSPAKPSLWREKPKAGVTEGTPTQKRPFD